MEPWLLTRPLGYSASGPTQSLGKLILKDFTKIRGLGAGLPDSHLTTLSLIPVQVGISVKYQQFRAVLLLYVLTVHMPYDRFFFFSLGRVTDTDMNSLMCLKFSRLNIFSSSPEDRLGRFDLLMLAIGNTCKVYRAK